MDAPETRYARCGDLSIAYQDFGGGPLTIVLIPPMASHLELGWEIPFLARWFRSLARFARVLVFDKRGTGLSDRSLGPGSIEDRMEDVHAVMDAAGVKRAAIVGMSEGGPMSIVFAATYPERVSALVLVGSFARTLWSEDYPIGDRREEIEPRLLMAEGLWGQGVVSKYVVFADAPEEAIPVLGRLERNSATPGVVTTLVRHNIEIDVRAALPAVSVPTLVLHNQGDPLIPVARGRYLAEHIPGARFVEFPGDFHVSWFGTSVDAHADELRTFLAGAGDDEPDVERVLTTVLFTDIISSTAMTETMGDRRWHDLLQEHDRVVEEELARHRGRSVKHTGDGVFASFDGPARGVRCARAIVSRARLLGIDVRAGLHTGECEARERDLLGMAVNIGARVCALAGGGEVLVSSTVRDLVIGSGITFEDRGRHALKGVAEPWHVLAATSA
jgi:class 3 adenylate cyclase